LAATLIAFASIGDQKHRIEPVHGCPHLSAGDPSIPLGHPQIPVPELTCDHIKLNTPLAEPGREGVALMPRAA